MTEVSVKNLTKRFGAVHAVEDLTFTSRSGRVTGFLGPNGAGKTTTLRIMLGLVRPTSGLALIGGRRYDELKRPRRVVGAVLEASGAHPGRRGRDHLKILARPAGVDGSRVEEVLAQVGLADAAERRIGGYSLGMKQRLGLAGAMLGDPEILVLDEPANGLDPEGIAWLRQFVRSLAAEGRTIIISSHVLSEVAQTVDDVVIINEGKLRYAGPLQELGGSGVVVSSPHVEELRRILAQHGCEVTAFDGTNLTVRGLAALEVGRIAAEAGIALASLREADSSLEAAFLQLTDSATTSTSDERKIPCTS